ncbi:FtsK/SpoIIIE domain-containing protein [Cellulomonas sp. PhB143]|uniref:FtsK/SpoIIIE domain-containing protein n=1 Tax=Cellulomonas sp. PhB143 TaxID=2485186 RepID=UPI000F48BB1E|nr:FtsK/SpoIIIE domain-containing protein [Cellulomonas sp. PhB143]ROS76733.1 S-DNA-T family DNA segregation ATPase FtsK/SpoIIIE [Cellulomonas sp. PhB143]
MKVNVTLARPDGTRDDIVVTADAGATISEVARTIARLDPRGTAPSGAPTLRAQLPGQDEPTVLPPDAALGEAWIGSGAVVSLVEPDAVRREHRAAPVRGSLEVEQGPDAGLRFELREGTVGIGRAPGNEIVLEDPQVSKRHARIEVGESIEVVDLGAANGIVVDGGLVPRVRITSAQRLVLGDSVVVVRRTAPPGGVTGVRARPGPVPFNRSPRVEERYTGATYEAPEVPAEQDPRDFPLFALLAPILMGGGMFAITSNPMSLLFVVLTPLMLVGNFLMQGKSKKRRLERDVRVFDERLEALHAKLGAERERERSVRLREAPAMPLVYAEAMRRGALLWTRRPEHWSFLNVRLGTGRMPSRNTIAVRDERAHLPDFQARIDALEVRYSTIGSVPVVENLTDAGAIGFAGPPAHTVGSLDAALVQLTALHSPAELVVAGLVSPAWTGPLQWLKWLPHTSSVHSPLGGPHLADSTASAAALVAELEELIARRSGSGAAARRGAVRAQDAAVERGADVGGSGTAEGTGSPLPAVVVVVTDDIDVERARLVQLMELGPEAGVFVLWVARDVRELPAACRTFVGFEDDGRAYGGLVRLGRTVDDLVPETVEPSAATDYGRRMAPVFDAGARNEDATDLPRSISVASLLGHDVFESADAVVDRWRQNGSVYDRTPGRAPARGKAGSLRATVGSAGIDPMHLDLRSQGPHALVGGTTGAGKSEFLQSWVLGMAAEYSSDRVTFLFVDYKGGSAFADCVRLPHCVGLVTDLSPHLVTRALTSLRAELHHREHLFNRKKAKDLLELEKRGDPETPPALVIVVDEFAALVGDVPEFVDGMIDVAQRGRSLGIHLILATQRPAGVIKDNLRANTPLRVALRMADESDSVDVVDVKDAAHFDPAVPGRGVVKTGPGRLQAFQSGYAGGWTSREPARTAIEVAWLRFGAEVRWEEPVRDVRVPGDESELGPNDQQRLVARIGEAHRAAGLSDPRRPWLDELADAYDVTRLPQRRDSELLLGVADLPDRQAQVPVYFTPDTDGHLAVFGTGGAGKSTALRSLATAAGITPRGGPVRVYALDFAAGSLRMLESLPHVGAVVRGEDTERVVGLWRMVRTELERRAPRFADVSASSVTEYRQITGAHDEPRILVLIDGFPAFRDDFETGAGRAEWFEVFRDVLTDGRQLGIHVAFTADRAGAVPTYVRSLVQRTVILRLADDGYVSFNAPRDILGPTSPPGRAIVDGGEAQVAVIGGTSSVSEQALLTQRFARSMRRAGIPEAPPVRALPTEYPVEDLPASVAGRPVLGLDGVDLEPLAFDPSGVALVAGPPASGRSNALAAMVLGVVRADPGTRCYLVGPARSGLRRALGWAGVAAEADDVARLAKDLLAAVEDEDTEGRIVVAVEGINEYLQSPADKPLVDLIKAVRRSDHLLLAEGETSTWTSTWPLLAEVKNVRRGLILAPDPMDGDTILRTSLPRAQRAEFPPGRGVWVARGKFVRVQTPWVLG